ncbi:MAG: NAD-dependent deacetylase [Actinomycetota bacterium]
MDGDDHAGAAGAGQNVAVFTISSADDPDVSTVASWIAEARRVTVLTGAGISTDSGIPDFRGPNGLWTKNPAAEKAATIEHYLGDPEVRRVAWQNRVRNLGRERPQPNSGHRALLNLEASGKLRAIITQNVDGLHLDAGHPRERVIEVHGSWRDTLCWDCGDRRPMSESIQRVVDGDEDPSCLECGGILKSATILFGEPLVPEVIGAAMAAAEDCDVFLAVGSTLSVGPVNNTVPRARQAGARVVILNGESTAMDRFAHALVIGTIGEMLPALLGGESRPTR